MTTPAGMSSCGAPVDWPDQGRRLGDPRTVDELEEETEGRDDVRPSIPAHARTVTADLLDLPQDPYSLDRPQIVTCNVDVVDDEGQMSSARVA